MPDKSKDRTESNNHFFVKPEITVYPKGGGGGGGIPLTYIPHDEMGFDHTRRSKGISYLLRDVTQRNETKKLKDNMVYFVVDFKVKGDHPACGAFLDRIKAKLLTFIDEGKTRAFVASETESLNSVTNTTFPPSTEKIVFDIRQIRMDEQVDKKILDDNSWKETKKSVDVFIAPNIDRERTEKYLQQIKKFLIEQKVEISDPLVDTYSNTGLITAKMNHSVTSNMLKEASFIYRVNETPKISTEELENANTSENIPSSSKAATNKLLMKLQALPEVCVIDSGLNLINPLSNVISARSHEPNLSDDQDDNDHGTSVAYLAVYGEGNQPRARIISHKIVSGPNESNLFLAIARAIMTYRHRARIFTCSVTFRENDDATNFETWKIDRLVQASNACVIFSAGNILPAELNRFSSLGFNYPTYLDSAPVMPPANSPSIMCVGACALHSNPKTSIAPPNSPAPFTRYKTQCNALDGCIKPEIVEHGGNLNINHSFKGIGVGTYCSSGFPTEKIGTSFSAPIIAGHAAEIIHKYGSKIKNAETIKAILLSACIPTANFPQYTGLGKPNYAEMLSSYDDSVKVIFEGELRLANPQLRRSVPSNRVAVYIPGGVDEVELLLVHSDNYNISSHLGLYTYIEVVPEKPARDTSPPPDIGDLNGREHVKRLVWSYQKAVRGVWFFMLVPHHIGIPFDKRENITLRYGGVIKLTSNSSRSNLINELKRKEYLFA